MSYVKLFNETGDTIVEVLMAIAIISIILGGAFVSANHSLANSRQAQERGEALKIAESQFEQLRLYAKDPSKSPAMFDTTRDFCIDSSGNVVPFTIVPNYDPSHDFPALANDDYSGVPAQCVFSFYHVSINYRYPGADSLFTMAIRWDRSISASKDQIIMSYKLHQ